MTTRSGTPSRLQQSDDRRHRIEFRNLRVVDLDAEPRFEFQNQLEQVQRVQPDAPRAVKGLVDSDILHVEIATHRLDDGSAHVVSQIGRGTVQGGQHDSKGQGRPESRARPVSGFTQNFPDHETDASRPP